MAMTGSQPTVVTKPKRTWLVITLIGIAVLAAIALDTKVVEIGSDEDARQQAFNPDDFGQANFPRIRDMAVGKAPEARQLADELAADKKAATDKYATMAGAFAVIPVKLTGVVGEGKSGIFDVAVEGLPEGTRVRVQTGPAINGTELRDLPGDIIFGDFKNQIEFQDAGSAINRAMSAEVLADLDRDTLTGKTISVTGVFKLINPKNWLVTPVQLEVQ